MIDLNNLSITGLRNFTKSEASSFAVHPYNGIVINLKEEIPKKEGERFSKENYYQLSSLIYNKQSKKFEPASFFIVRKSHNYIAKLAKLNSTNSYILEVVNDEKKLAEIRWLKKDCESIEKCMLGNKILEYGNLKIENFDTHHKKYFDYFNTPSRLFCNSYQFISLTDNVDLIPCSVDGLSINDCKFYLFNKDEDSFITSLTDIFDAKSHHIHIL